MTNVTISRQGSKVWFRCEGHANYGESGKDIVCAGVSTLAQSYAALIEKYEKHKEITLKRFLISDGLVDIIVDDNERKLESSLNMMILGFGMLEDEYPKNIHLEWGEIKKSIV